MSPTHPAQQCALNCPWKGTAMCAQCLVNAQAREDGRLTLGVLCGLKRLYQPHALPPCIVKSRLEWHPMPEREVSVAA